MKVIETDEVELGQIRSDGINHYLVVYNPPEYYDYGDIYNAIQLTDNFEDNVARKWESLYLAPVKADTIKDDLPTILSGKLIIEIGE